MTRLSFFIFFSYKFERRIYDTIHNMLLLYKNKQPAYSMYIDMNKSCKATLHTLSCFHFENIVHTTPPKKKHKIANSQNISIWMHYANPSRAVDDCVVDFNLFICYINTYNILCSYSRAWCELYELYIYV